MDSKSIKKSVRWCTQLWFAAAWKLLGIFNISHFWPSSGHFLQKLLNAIDFSNENTPIAEVSASSINEFLVLKTACSFQAAANHSSVHQRTLFLIDLESKSHELFKNAIKRLIFEWHGGKPAGYLIWKISNLDFGHQLVQMVRSG